MGYYSSMHLRVMETPLEKGETVKATLKALTRAEHKTPICDGCNYDECRPFQCPFDPYYQSIVKAKQQNEVKE